MSNQFEIFFVDSKEALSEVKALIPEVKEFDTRFLELCTEEERVDIAVRKENYILILSSEVKPILTRVHRDIGPVWILVPEEDPRGGQFDSILQRIANRAWSYDREIGNGALCGTSILGFLPNFVWVCQGKDRANWFAVRDRNGPSMILGVFDERFKATRQAHAVV